MKNPQAGDSFRIGNVTNKPTKKNPTIDQERGPSVTSSAQKSNGPMPSVRHSPSKADQS